jgi:hypothetical protein
MTKKALPNFHERFDITVNISSAHQRFFNRIKSLIWDNYFKTEIDEATRQGQILWQIAINLGEEYEYYNDIEDYIGDDYYKCLHALEIAYDALKNKKFKTKLEGLILLALSLSEIDLGIYFKEGHFLKSGAKLLDDELINKSIEWLRDNKYKSVYTPFEKGLSGLIEAGRKTHLLSDVITDMYESLEALAKIVTKKSNKDLSSNAEMFIKMINVSDNYKRILKEYISYANNYRHGQPPEGTREIPTYAEVESFVYLTGIFIRLAICAT